MNKIKNIFSYQYGSIFTGKEIKDFLHKWEADGHSMYGLRQYLKCEDSRLYWFVNLGGTAAGEREKGFCRVEPRENVK